MTQPAQPMPTQSHEPDAGAAVLPALSLASLAALTAGCGGGQGDGAAGTGGLQGHQAPPLAASGPVRQAPLLGAGWVSSDGRAQRLATPTAPLPSPQQLMDWGERNYFELFPGPAPQLQFENIAYRFYPATGNYLGVEGQRVLVLGAFTNNEIVEVGTLAGFADAVFNANALARSDAQAARFLLQAQFSATDADIATVRAQGFATWLDREMARPVVQKAWDWLVSRGYSARDSRQYYFAEYPGDFMAWYQLMAAPDAVRQRCALALSEFFVVSLQGIASSIHWPAFAIAHHWDNLCQHAFGNFRPLLEAVTLSPAMGGFLNLRGNQKADPASGRLPDENFAREVMQLFSIGLNQLDLNGTPKRDATGATLDTYGPDDVSHLARVFTGFDYDTRVGEFFNPLPPFQGIDRIDIARRPMVLDATRHSVLEKRFLGTVIPAGTPGLTALRMALDALFQHPNVGPFFGRQMIQRLVSSNPTPAYVARVAAVFNNNGAGVRGDLKAVFKAILLDDEARGAPGLDSLTHGKLREPMLRFAQWGRSFGLRSRIGSWKLFNPTINADTTLGQSPLQAPSVFNFFRPGHVPPGTDMAATGATAPEFQGVNESSVSAYPSFLNQVLFSGVFVRAPEVPYPVSLATTTDGYDIAPDYGREIAMAHDSARLVQRLNLLMCAGQLAPDTEQAIVQALKLDEPAVGDSLQFKTAHVARALMFVMSSPDYLVQR